MTNRIKSILVDQIKQGRGKKAVQEATLQQWVDRTFLCPTGSKIKYYILNPLNDDYVPFASDLNVAKYLAACGFFNGIAQGEEETKKEFEARKKYFLLSYLKEVVETRRVHAVMEVAGHQAGIIAQGLDRILVTRGPQIIEPQRDKEGQWVRTLIEQMTGDGALRVHLWLARAYQCLVDQKHAFGHVLIMIGPNSCGKSLLQHRVFTPVLGGREIECFRQLSGATHFNKTASGCEHLFSEDPSKPKDFDRQRLADEIKRKAAVAVEYTEGKNVDAVATKAVVQRVSISINADDLSMVPAFKPDTSDKLLVIACKAPDILKGLSEKEIEPLIEADLPGYLWWLQNKLKPGDLVLSEDSEELSTIRRFGFKSFIDETYREAIEQESDAENLRNLIHEKYFPEAKPGEKITGPSPDFHCLRSHVMFLDLLNDPRVGKSIDREIKNQTRFGTLMMNLCRKYPSEFLFKVPKNKKFYTITRPKCEKEPSREG